MEISAPILPAPTPDELRPIGLPENQLAIRRAAAHLCGRLAWVVLHEVPLPNGRRADIVALDMAASAGLADPLPAWRSATTPPCGIYMVAPGAVALEAEALSA